MTTGPDNAGRMQGGQFAPGCSGNPAGMKLGARHRATRLAEKLIAGDAEDVVKVVVDAANGQRHDGGPAGARSHSPALPWPARSAWLCRRSSVLQIW